MPTLEKKMVSLGLILPKPAAAVAAYVPYVVSGSFVFISGQLPMENGQLNFTGLVGQDVDLTEAQKAAHICGLNLLAQLNEAIGGKIDRIERCVKLGCFVASAPDFFDQPKVANGASELMEQVLGNAGKHARFAVGVGNLPRNAAVEIDAVFSLKSPEKS